MVVCMGFAAEVAICLLTLATAHAEWINIRVIHEGAGNLLLEGGNGPQVPVHPHTAGLSRILYTLPISKPIQVRQRHFHILYVEFYSIHSCSW